MLKQYSPTDALNTILKRTPLEDMPVTKRMQEGIRKLFGKSLTPAQVVDLILKDVRKRGDEALREWTLKLDGVELDSLRVPQEKIQAATTGLSLDLREALDLSIERVRKFHQSQPVGSWITQEMGGQLGQLIRPIRRVGLCIPAGSAPLPSSVIMSAVAAQVAGVSEIVIVSPPAPDTGEVAPVILAAANLLGIDEIYALGGAQAVAALAYGTSTIQPVDKIFGPGNLFVTLAKKQVYGTVGIDSLAGPTETVVIADAGAKPAWVAADLLAQAEHDVLAAAILLTPSEELIRTVQAEIEKQLKERSRAAVIRESLAHRSGAVLTRDLDEAVDLVNRYAPEHLCLAVEDPWTLSEQVNCAGGIFIGENSCEVLGDYVAGPSHVMPTGGSARFNSPLNVLDFVHIVSLVALNPATAGTIARSAEVIARVEGLDAHAYAAYLRTSAEEA